MIGDLLISGYPRKNGSIAVNTEFRLLLIA